MRRGALLIALTAVALSGCVEQHKGQPQVWYAAHGAVLPQTHKVSVCHGFGCQLKTSVAFGSADLRKMRGIFGKPKSAAQERAAIARYISWAEKRVAPEVGSEDDVGGLDLMNSGVHGQMDCIDEAANTTSYLMMADKNGLLRFHTVGSPVARGFFLDGRYPHATAVVVDDGGTPWAIDSWPHRNGVPPNVLPLSTWFARSAAS
ncbi:hypothetical protein [Acuticoccus kandeliae]|uniref:hypothetical protein n=1 Tax=Acuticoccus kandeliae TaxID=2073160 RepID=UPI000D3E7208|nr:hypothetical protein [Acuticoccus kandeliae]